MAKKHFNPKRLLPLSLSVAIILLDQFTKFLVVKYIPVDSVYASFWGGLVRIIHVRNLGAAFSLGNTLPVLLRDAALVLVPIAIVLWLTLYTIRAKSLSSIQRWMLAGIIGGGTGNLIDRIFRPLGVVDFVDVKFFGIFGLDRWPTFNLADSVVVVCGMGLFISFLFQDIHAKKKKALEKS